MSDAIRISDLLAPNFHELHKSFKADDYNEYWLRGGRGSTKSSFLSIEIILEILRNPEANAVVFRRFENEIRDSVFSQLQWAINMLGVDHLFKAYTSPFKLRYEPTGQLILFKGADNPKKLKSIKLAKGHLRLAWFEEVDQYANMDEIRNIEQSILRGSNEKQIVLFSYNPPKSARSWVNEESKTPKEGRIVHYSDYTTVPPKWLGKTFIANAEHLLQTNEEAYRHEYLGEETGTGLEVFNNVTLRTITSKEISYFDHRFQGLDFGYAADPLCFEEFHFDAKKKRLYIFAEISGVGLKNAQFAIMLTDDQRVEVTMSDSSEPKSIDELRDEHKVNVMPVDKYPGSVEHGVKYMQDLEEIIIDPMRCPLAATEFINYALDMNRNGEVISKYPDKGNHCFVGETLILTPYGSKRIDQVRPGDEVITRQGPRRVNKVFRNHLPVVTTKLLNGKSLTLTDTHCIITARGKVMFNDLTPHDTVYYEDGPWRFIETENRKLPYLRARGIAAIQKASDEMTECISSAQLRQGQTSTSILRYTQLLMGKFQKVAMCTIRMGTLSTTIRAISSALMVQSIFDPILSSITKITKMLYERISSVFDRLQKSGMAAKRAVSGMLNMPERCFSGAIPWSVNASSVAGSFEPRTSGSPASVPMLVNQLGGALQALTTNGGYARAVGATSTLTSIPRSVPAQGNVRHVYDLEIDEVHEYFANGILVSNSIDACRYGLSQQIKTDRIQRRKSKFRARPIPVASRW